jgi:predicted HTH transcriptional regulator
MVASAEYDPVIVEPQLTSQRVSELVSRKRESAKLDYKQQYHPGSTHEKVEIVKDLVAMANTAGGYIVIGVDNAGDVVGLTESEALAIDEATVRAQVESYLGVSIDLFVDNKIDFNGKRLVVLTVLRSRRAPLVFERDGDYRLGSRKQSIAFAVGDVFVRHGSKSEKWNQDDVREIYARVVEREKERWLADVLPDIRAAISAASAQPVAAQLDPAAVVRTDAETFERTITSIVRRSS